MSRVPINELRTDLLTGRQVIIAEGRRMRPVQTYSCAEVLSVADDPFLEGNEPETPHECLALRQVNSEQDAPGWLVRVVPNRYPAVRPLNADDASLSGVHDVVLECPDFRTRLANLSVLETARVIRAWQLRVSQINELTAGDTGTLYVFRNEGRAAGASLAHCHSQILWLPRCANNQQDVDVRLRKWVQTELDAAERVLLCDDELVVVCPYGARVSWHTRITSSAEIPFDELSESVILNLARWLQGLVRRVESLIGEFPHNLTLSFSGRNWHLDFLPRTGGLAGLELMSELDLVTLSPESAACELRDCLGELSTGADGLIVPDSYSWRTGAD